MAKRGLVPKDIHVLPNSAQTSPVDYAGYVRMATEKPRPGAKRISLTC